MPCLTPEMMQVLNISPAFLRRNDAVMQALFETFRPMLGCLEKVGFYFGAPLSDIISVLCSLCGRGFI
jgi:hypothetical protein